MFRTGLPRGTLSFCGEESVVSKAIFVRDDGLRNEWSVDDEPSFCGGQVCCTGSDGAPHVFDDCRELPVTAPIVITTVSRLLVTPHVNGGKSARHAEPI